MYFNQLTTVESVKSQFSRLCAEHHPDLGGSAETFTAIYREYLEALKRLDRTTSTGSDNKQHTYFFDGISEAAIADKLGQMLALRMPGVKVALIGKWLWTLGDTRAYRDQLKALGCRYSGDKESWYYHTGTYRKRGKRPASWDSMRKSYGATEYSTDDAR
jgi:hypothetical protein